jgi:hypothetical protein
MPVAKDLALLSISLRLQSNRFTLAVRTNSLEFFCYCEIAEIPRAPQIFPVVRDLLTCTCSNFCDNGPVWLVRLVVFGCMDGRGVESPLDCTPQR